MKVIIADTYSFYLHNSKNLKFPKQFRSYKIIWDMREALLAIWEGKITDLAIPALGTPGYDFEEFSEQMKSTGQIKVKPKLRYYELILEKKK